MPNPRIVVDTVAHKFSDNEILQRVASKLDDGSMAWKVDIIGGLSLTVGDINIGAVNILNASDVQINPATEETLQEILDALGGESGVPFHLFDSATSVPTYTPTFVLSYTVPEGKTLHLKHVAGSGNLYSKWTLWVGEGVVAVRRASDGGGLNVEFDFSDSNNVGGLAVAAGEIVRLQVVHNRPWMGDFEADFSGRLV